MVDNPKKDSKIEGKDNPETWTPPEGFEFLQQKFVKGAKDTNEAVRKQAMSQPEAEKKLREVEAERNKIETELNEIKSGGVTSFDEAMLAEKEDELARVKAENEALKKPKSTLSAEHEAMVKDWHSKLVSDNPVVAAKAVQDAIAGEIYRYDQVKKAEEQGRSFQRQMEKAASTHSKKELDALAKYVVDIRRERPELERSPHGVEDILDKAKVRLAEDNKADEVDAEAKKTEKEQIGSTIPTETGALEKELTWDDVEKMSIPEREKYLHDHGVEVV